MTCVGRADEGIGPYELAPTPVIETDLSISIDLSLWERWIRPKGEDGEGGT